MRLLRRRGSASSSSSEEGHDAVDAPAVQAGMPEGAPPPVTDPEERLRRLSDLRDRGLLTDEEFAEQKVRVLGS